MTDALTLDSITVTSRGLVARAGAERVEVEAWRADVVRVRVSRGGALDSPPSPAVVAEPQDVAVLTEVADDVAVVRTPALTVTVQRSPFRLDVRRADGSAVVTGLTYADSPDGWTVRRHLAPGDQVYGLGERTGPGNRRGRTATLWNTDVLDPHGTAQFAAAYPPGDPRGQRDSAVFDPYYVAIPMWHHRDAATGAVAGGFADTPHRGVVDLTGEDHVLRVDGGQWTEYLLAGPGMDQVLEAYTWLTGRMPAPPVWALGHHQCRWHRYTAAELLALADAMRAADVPCDAFWLDIDHMRGFRVFTWDEEAVPDPSALAAGLAERGAKLVTIVDPGVKVDPGWDVYDHALANDLLCRTPDGEVYVGEVWPGDTAFPDVARPQVRAWWGELNAAHVARGVAGIWNDMNEPATGSVPPDAMWFDHGRVPHAAVHNTYALLMAQGTVAGLRAARPDERTFVLSRAGSAGIQRYAATWTGDNQARWDHLAVSVPMSTGLGLSGQPFVGSDIGGFAGEPDAELYTRWVQYGMLTPFARGHQMTGQADRYPWSYGPQVLDRVRAAVRLRYRLMPALVSAFAQASATGLPVQRPLVLADQTDPALAEVDDAYLLGDHLLVAPVLAPGVTERPVRLPRGRWLDWHTEAVHDGGSEVTVPAPIDHVPLLVRAGAVIPLWPAAPASAAGYQPAEIELHLVPGPAGTEVVSVLHEDDGTTTAAESGAFVRTTLVTRRDGDVLHLVAGVEGDGFAEHRRAGFRLVLRGAQARQVHLDGEPVPADAGGWWLPTGTRGFEVQVHLA